MEQETTEASPETTVDQELGAMATLVDTLERLDNAARDRVLRWVNDRFPQS
ncbi:MAG: hypothetical protein J2P17_17055 [Mycobacterium sp.]|nr:hypothetical protein [Mycobacterium sp.]